MKTICSDYFPDYKQYVYVEPFKEAISLIQKSIEAYGSQDSLGKEFNYTQGIVSCWVRGLNYIPLHVLHSLCIDNKVDFFKLIERKRIRGRDGGGSLIFSKRLIEDLVIIDGFIRGDGHIKPNPSGCITCYQKDRETLEWIRDYLISLGINRGSMGLKKDKGRDSHQLFISSVPLKYILVEILQNPVGKKPINLDVPKRIYKFKREVILSEIGSILAAEGNFSYSSRSPSIRLTTKSTLPIRVMELLRFIGHESYIVKDKRDGYKSIRVSGHEKCLKLCYELLPYVISYKKYNDMLRMLSTERYLSALRYSIDSIFERGCKAFGSQEKLRYATIKEHGIRIPRRTFQNWIYGKRKPTVRILVIICKILNIDPNTVFPEEFSLLFYLHRISNLNMLEKKRGNIGRWIHRDFRLHQEQGIGEEVR